MSKYYKRLNSIGLTISIGFVSDSEEIPTGTVIIDSSEYDRINKLLDPVLEDDELSGNEEGDDF